MDQENAEVSAGADEFDLNAAVDSVAGDLFKSEESVPAEPAAAPELPAAAETPPAETPSVAKKPLPKSWKQEMAPVWDQLPPEVHEYVYHREADVMRGIQQYQQGYQAWNQFVQPFQEVFKQHPNVNPVQLAQGLMSTHLRLLSAPPDERKALAAQIFRDYGIDFSGESGASPEADQYARELQALKAELQSLKSGFTETQKRAYESAVAEQRKVVDSFFSDPKNEFAEEVQNDILRLMQTGVANDLASAYEQACWLNPAVRAKILAKQQATALPEQAKPAAKFPNVESDPNAKPARGKKQSMEDTINSIAAKYANQL